MLWRGNTRFSNVSKKMNQSVPADSRDYNSYWQVAVNPLSFSNPKCKFPPRVNERVRERQMLFLTD